jgi:hypothetical protein
LKFNSLFVGPGSIRCSRERAKPSRQAGVEMNVNALPPQTTLLSLSSVMPRKPNRRDDGREHTLLRIGCLLFDDRRELCLIRNVSAGGALVRTYSKLPQGSAVAIELKQGESVAGVVRWAEDNMIGVMFHHMVDVVQLLADSSDWPRPRQPRVEIRAIAWLEQGSQTLVGEALDLSQGGMKVRMTGSLTENSPLLVTLRGLPPQRAFARWRYGNLQGIEFVQALPLKTLVRWVREQQASSRGRIGGEAA